MGHKFRRGLPEWFGLRVFMGLQSFDVLAVLRGSPGKRLTHRDVVRKKHNTFYDLVSEASYHHFCFVSFLRRESPSSVYTQEDLGFAS